MNARIPLPTDELDALADRIAETAALIDAATHRLLSDIRTFDEAEGWHRQGALSCAHWLSWRAGIDLGAAREKVRVARALGALPLLDDALREGVLSYSKARAVTRVAKPENEATLLEIARESTASQLEKICRLYRQVEPPLREPPARFIRLRETGDGMVRLEAQLTTDEAALVMRACELSAETSDGKTDRVLGLVAMAEAALRGDAPARPPVEVMMHVDADTLAGNLEDGRGLLAETCRRLLCDAGVVPVLDDKGGKPLDVGRKTRTIPVAIRRALKARDGGCKFPGCTNHRFVDGHHIVHWADGGETNLENLTQLCRAHHGLVHEGRFRVSVLEDGTTAFFFPGGARVPATGIPRRLAAAGEKILRTSLSEAGVVITPATAYPRWDGEPVDYATASTAWSRRRPDSTRSERQNTLGMRLRPFSGNGRPGIEERPAVHVNLNAGDHVNVDEAHGFANVSSCSMHVYDAMQPSANEARKA